MDNQERDFNLEDLLMEIIDQQDILEDLYDELDGYYDLLGNLKQFR
jgi:hypothetical protein